MKEPFFHTCPVSWYGLYSLSSFNEKGLQPAYNEKGQPLMKQHLASYSKGVMK